MKRIFTTRIGLWNIGVIVLLTVLVGFFSIISLASKEQIDAIKQHLFHFLLYRHFFLLLFALSVLGALLLINIIVDAILRKRINGYKLLAILVWGVLSTFFVSVVGDFILFS